MTTYRALERTPPLRLRQASVARVLDVAAPFVLAALGGLVALPFGVRPAYALGTTAAGSVAIGVTAFLLRRPVVVAQDGATVRFGARSLPLAEIDDVTVEADVDDDVLHWHVAFVRADGARVRLAEGAQNTSEALARRNATALRAWLARARDEGARG